MRLTAELIKGSLSYNNPLGERELDLRGHKIPAIENLGSAKDQECLDLTDNNLVQLNNFPTSPRLHTLLCAQNRIATLADNLPKNLPNLHTLVLTQNNVAELADVDVLKGFASLTYVSLLGNPVTSKENYRYWILSRNPHIRFLDFQKVKDAERKQAKDLFGTPEAPTDLATSILRARSGTSAFAAAQINANGEKAKNFKATEEEKKRFQVLVQKATTLAEVQKLEKLYNEGRLPSGLLDGDSMDET